MPDPRQIEEYFHQQIPLTRAMQVRVAEVSPQRLVLEAPLEANHNHLGTAFGGSLSAIATLAGYGLLWVLLDDREAHVVVRESMISYRRPVRGLIRAVCIAPAEAAIEEFRAAFSRNGKARMQLTVTIDDDSAERAVTFEGTFVAVR